MRCSCLRRGSMRHAMRCMPLKRDFAVGYCNPRTARESDTVALTQEFLAEMLGVRRTSVNEVASRIQASGAISYTRGQITILDLLQFGRDVLRVLSNTGGAVGYSHLGWLCPRPTADGASFAKPTQWRFGARQRSPRFSRQHLQLRHRYRQQRAVGCRADKRRRWRFDAAMLGLRHIKSRRSDYHSKQLY